MKNPKKNPLKHTCNVCDFSSSHKNDFLKHISTLKHKRKLLETFGNPKNPFFTSLHICSICNKEYKSKSGLWKHKKACTPDLLLKEIPLKDASLNNVNTNELLSLLLKQQEEINNKNNELLELSKTKNTINNTNNISINIFLNEHCKDAMNLTDFVENLKLSLEDLNYTGKHGYVKGVANILIKNLGEIDPKERPIHCTDKKRLQFYVKDENRWEKDNNNKKIDESIAKVTSRQYKKIKDWEELNKGYESSGEKMNSFFKITSNCNPSDDNSSLKVMKDIAENVQIKKAISEITLEV